MGSRTVSAVLFARDYLRLAAFCRDAVGLPLVRQLDDHAVLSYPGFDLVVHQIPGRFLTDATTTSVRRREGGTIKLSFPVDDLDRVRRVTASLGGVFDPPESEWMNGDERTCMGHDPEGNVFQVSALDT